MMIETMNVRMLRFLKQIVWLTMLVACVLANWSARAFSLGGPIANGPDSYQTITIGYNAQVFGELNAPKVIGEGYRRVTPIMYYAPDGNFAAYFGSDGINALDQAFTILNGVTNVDAYSTNLFEFPMEAQRVNQLAANFGITDVKSTVLGEMMEQLGLFQPVRAVWMLRSRFLPPGGVCPTGEEYFIIQRNIDVVPSPTDQFQYTDYVNGTLYSFFIFESCGAPGVSPPDPVADAVEVPVDPLAQQFTAVADATSVFYDGMLPGGFYTGLTRDDVAGLRYLIDTNNFAIEDASAGTTEFLTNSQPAVIATQDLSVLAADALTNDPVTLAGLFPGLVVTGTVTNLGLSVSSTVTETLVNSPYDPPGTPPSHPLFTTNFTTNVVSFYQETFGNVVTNSFSTRGLIGTITVGLTPPTTPAGTTILTTNKARLSFVNGVFGDFFILPANLCGAGILSNILTTVTATTNAPVGSASTNSVTFSPGSITFTTNHEVVYLPVTCPTDPVAAWQGIGQMTFLRRDFDSLLNQFWDPVTNEYTKYVRTNGFIVPQRIQRIVTAPDFLFSAADIGVNAQGAPQGISRNLTFNQANVPANQAGPGTIQSSTTITFNSVGPAYEVAFTGSSFLGQLPTSDDLAVELTWGSYDGTTNTPVIYPNGTSFLQLEQQVFGPSVITTSLPNGAVGVAYSTTPLAGTGGKPPYTWALTPGSGLPTGLALSTGGLISGTPAGPANTYDLSIRITDSAGAFNDASFTLIIDP